VVLIDFEFAVIDFVRGLMFYVQKFVMHRVLLKAYREQWKWIVTVDVQLLTST